MLDVMQNNTVSVGDRALVNVFRTVKPCVLSLIVALLVISLQ